LFCLTRLLVLLDPAITFAGSTYGFCWISGSVWICWVSSGLPTFALLNPLLVLGLCHVLGICLSFCVPLSPLQPELCSLLAILTKKFWPILTKIFTDTNQNVEGILTRFLRGYHFGPVVPSLCSFDSFGSASLLLWFSRSIPTFTLVWSILFSTSVWLRRSVFSVCSSFLCVVSFLRFWVQGGHSFEPIYWPFVGGRVGAAFLTFTRTLVSCSSCLPRLL